MKALDRVYTHPKRWWQVLSKVATRLWRRVVESYQAGDAAGLATASEQLMAMLADMDALLSTQRWL